MVVVQDGEDDVRIHRGLLEREQVPQLGPRQAQVAPVLVEAVFQADYIVQRPCSGRGKEGAASLRRSPATVRSRDAQRPSARNMRCDTRDCLRSTIASNDGPEPVLPIAGAIRGCNPVVLTVRYRVTSQNCIAGCRDLRCCDGFKKGFREPNLSLLTLWRRPRRHWNQRLAAPSRKLRVELLLLLSPRSLLPHDVGRRGGHLERG